MFFDKINLWQQIKSYEILHFAPERNLSEKIRSLKPVKYVRADFYPKNESTEKIDATNIPYQSGSFDLILCNHVLEHIANYKNAIKEIYRVLKPNGRAILQTPYTRMLNNNFEDENLSTDQQRLFFYGERDHVRIFSENQFLNDLQKAGFKLKILKNSDFFDDQVSSYYGVNKEEDLIQVVKPCNC
jgi:SAM-dependent methyltransferase